MTIFCETPRLLLREILPTDVDGMFALDSDPEVHRYLGNHPISSKEQAEKVIAMIRQQYIDNGIGRWAVIHKASNAFLGWAGLKYVKEPINNHNNFYDLGYRFIQQYWGQGYASEAALAARNYAFAQLQVNELYAWADMQNLASRRVLEKAGMRHEGSFEHDGCQCAWLKLARGEWAEHQ